MGPLEDISFLLLQATTKGDKVVADENYEGLSFPRRIREKSRLQFGMWKSRNQRNATGTLVKHKNLEPPHLELQEPNSIRSFCSLISVDQLQIVESYIFSSDSQCLKIRNF